ncbi:hypothetical protein EFA69_18685 [Rufibacter immobilis]|uniref:Tetratricopeptide repeat protein n=1 Tax=Rufibacter immobilis TaxID=1348778 RepID=A0A3M9MSB4_9BACT|nr:DUF6340 family protein [Rufibacter immobilis]RNI28105.1 hypothetical protein EFA69_18685 [Rufibacter immobilis]
MKTYSPRLVIACLCLFLSSCTSVLYLDREEPAIVQIPDEIARILLVQRYDASLLPYKKERKVEVFRDGAINAMEAVRHELALDTTFQVVLADTSLFLQKPVADRLITKAKAQQLCREYNASLLLVLDTLDAYMDQASVTREKDEQGNVSKIADYFLVVSTKWRLYTQEGELLDEATLTHSEPYGSRGVISGLLAIGPAMANAGEAVNRNAAITGKMYADRFYPTKFTITKEYFHQKELAQAAEYIRLYEWEKASELLVPLAKGKSTSLAGKAAYNLAVIHEVQGNLEEARK